MKQLLPFLLLAAMVGTSACTDSLLVDDAETGSPGSESFHSTAESNSKARHAGLMDRAVRGSDLAGKGGNGHLGLIVKIKKQSILERYKVLERYKIMERYKVLERYEYNEVIGGFAISVEDSLGLVDYQAFLDELDNDPDIGWYEPDFDLSLPEQTTQGAGNQQVIPWSVAAIGGQESWARSGDGRGSVDLDVYVLDTGVAKAWNGDPDDDLALRENIDFRGMDAPRDYEGHGTHVAGIVGAIDDRDNIVGVAPGVRLHNFKVLNDDGTADVSVLLAAIEELTARKAANPRTPMVVNLSLGEHMGNDLKTALDEALEVSIATGVHYIVAAGNDGVRAKHVTPAKVAGAVTVGSYDMNGLYSGFSNWGSAVDILAPGENIISLSKDGTSAVSMSGTSMAAAHVTGALALYVAQNPMASPAEAKAHLLRAAKSFVLGAPSQTTDLSVWVGDAAAPAPQFLNFALFAHEKLDLDADSRVQHAGDSSANASVHANGELKVDNSSTRVLGFGTYAEKLDVESRSIFAPASNPLAQASVRQVDAVAFSGFDAQSFAGQATRSQSGDVKLRDRTLRLSDDPNRPSLIFVDGKIKFDGHVTVRGYGVLYATENVEIDGHITGASGLGIFSTESIKIGEEELRIEATLVSGGSIELDEGTTLVGAAHAAKDIAVKEESRVLFSALPRSLTTPFWK